MGLLSLSIWTPIVFGGLLLALGRDEHSKAVRWLALVGALISLLVTLPLYAGFQLDTAALQWVEKALWIERFQVHYHLGVDGISLWLVLLTAFITPVVVLAGWEVITERVNQYMGAFLILSGLMVGVFSAQDAMLFYVFFEATLIPMYLIIGIWGGPNKIYAAFKFFLYTLLGSLLMLVALIYLYTQSGGTNCPWAARPKPCCFLPSLPPLLSKCRCGLCTPGCPMCTSKRPPAGRPFWRRSCSNWAPMAFCAFPCPSCQTHRANGPG